MFLNYLNYYKVLVIYNEFKKKKNKHPTKKSKVFILLLI